MAEELPTDGVDVIATGVQIHCLADETTGEKSARIVLLVPFQEEDGTVTRKTVGFTFASPEKVRDLSAALADAASRIEVLS